MMNIAWWLVGAVIVVALTHSLFPDHWVPYVAIARAHHWPHRRMLAMAAVGAATHLLSTATVGLVFGLFFQGVLSSRGELVESLTGLIVVGFGLWLLWRSIVGAKHGHSHGEMCVHGEREAERQDSLTLGAIFGLRPCVESLPLFLQAAAKGWPTAATAILAWAAASVAGMVAIVYIGYTRMEKIRLGWLERYAEILAGAVIVLVGLGVLAFRLLHG